MSWFSTTVHFNCKESFFVIFCVLFKYIFYNILEGDSVAGICYVGTRNTLFRIVFILAPLILYLILGNIALTQITGTSGQKKCKQNKLLMGTVAPKL